MARLLLLGSGRDIYRRYLLESVSREHDIVLTQASPLTWQNEFVRSGHVVHPAEHQRLIDVALNEKVDGVLTWVESCVEAASVVSTALGLPGHPPSAARASRDKHVMRSSWAQSGVASATSYLVHGVDEARRVAGDLGYPVVLKPRALAGSVGVTLATNDAELVDAFAVAGSAGLDQYEDTVSGVLLEEYLDGPELSVESIVQRGEVHIVAVTEKRVGKPPGFEELGHRVWAESAERHPDALRQVVADAHAGLGLTDGATHTEVRLTRAGPKLVELAARLGGDLIPKLVWHAAGVDLALAAAAVAVGQTPDLRVRRSRCAEIAFLYPETSGTVASLSPPPLVTSPDEVGWTSAIGTTVALPPDGFIGRLGYVLCVDDDPTSCSARLRSLAGAMTAGITAAGTPPDVFRPVEGANR